MDMGASPRISLLGMACIFSALMLIRIHPIAAGDGPWAATNWTNANATWYGGQDGEGTLGGACGYGNNNWRGYGMNSAALSTALFNGGLSCGACFELKCIVEESRWCYANAGSIVITATNFCPPNPSRPRDGWCNLPRTHFDLPYAMFTTLSNYVAGIIPVQYRRVPCVKRGGMRFTLNGNPWFNLVLISNVGGAGNVVSAQMRGSNSNNGSWFPMRQNWGQMWECSHKLVGQNISFQVTLGFGQTQVFANVAPATWKFQQTYEASTNFNPTLFRGW